GGFRGGLEYPGAQLLDWTRLVRSCGEVRGLGDRWFDLGFCQLCFLDWRVGLRIVRTPQTRGPVVACGTMPSARLLLRSRDRSVLGFRYRSPCRRSNREIVGFRCGNLLTRPMSSPFVSR